MAAGAQAARATVATPDGGALSAGWPHDDVDESGPAERLVVQHRGATVGHVALVLSPGQALGGARRRLLDEVAAQAGMAFQNVALTTALRGRAAALAWQQDELAASRRRLRAAVDEERERVATAIRREVTVHLVPLPAALHGLLGPDRLNSLLESTERAIAALREVTAGIVPPLLARRGLVAAVTDAIVGRAVGSTLDVDDALVERRFDPSLEATAYLCCVAVLDAVPRVRIGIEVRDGRLVVSIAGGSVGDLPPAVVDRVHAMGGQLTDEPLTVLLPPELPASAQTAASRSGPNADLVT